MKDGIDRKEEMNTFQLLIASGKMNLQNDYLNYSAQGNQITEGYFCLGLKVEQVPYPLGTGGTVIYNFMKEYNATNTSSIR